MLGSPKENTDFFLLINHETLTCFQPKCLSDFLCLYPFLQEDTFQLYHIRNLKSVDVDIAG